MLNVIDRLIQSAKGADNKIDKSESTRLALERAFEKLEQRYEKLEKVNYRILSINQVPDDQTGFQEAIDANTASYTERIEAYGQLKLAMMPKQNQPGPNDDGPKVNIKTVTDLKPSFSLSIDNTPMASGIRGGCCNPSYWEDRIGGWPLCRRSAKGSKWLAKGPHYTVD